MKNARKAGDTPLNTKRAIDALTLIATCAMKSSALAPSAMKAMDSFLAQARARSVPIIAMTAQMTQTFATSARLAMHITSTTPQLTGRATSAQTTATTAPVPQCALNAKMVTDLF